MNHARRRPFGCRDLGRCLPLALGALLMLSGIATAQVSPGNDLSGWLRRDDLVRSSRPIASGAARFEEVRDTATGSPYHGLTITILTLPRSEARIRVEPVVRQADLGTMYRELARRGDIAVINGGFFGMNGVPEGLVVSGGRAANPAAAWGEGGMLVQRGGRVSIEPVRSFRPAGTEEAIQSKPILVWDGRIDGITPAQRARFNRMAVALRGSDLLIVGAFRPTTRALSQYEFAQLLATPQSDGGLGVRAALGLDGGPGAFLHLPAFDLQRGIGGVGYLPNIIHITLR